MNRPVRVVKVGGSLYGTPDLADTLSAVFEAATSSITLLVPGGGVFADRIRHQQQHSALSEAEAHREALRAMTDAGQWLRKSQPGMTSVIDVDARRLATLAVADQGNAGLPLRGILQGCEYLESVPELPVGWETTSDAVALWCALTLGASCLTLLKSVPPPAGDPRQLSILGYLDATFSSLLPAFAGTTEVLWPGAVTPVKLVASR